MTRTDHAAKTAPAPPLPTAEVERLAGEIAEVAAHIDAATHRLLTLVRRFDEGSGWATHGALSCAHWLNWRIGIDLGAARERVRVARALGALPVLDDALRRGAVSYSKVRAITRVATPANEATLLDMARHTTASQLERICRGYRRVLTNLADPPESLADEELRRFVRTRETDDGMVRIEAQLRPEEAGAVLRALDVARQRAWRARRESRSAPDRRGETSAETSQPARAGERPGGALARADALVAVAESYLAAAAEAVATAGAMPVELVVHVDAATLRADRGEHDPLAAAATLDDGTVLLPATAQRLACDASVVEVIEERPGNAAAIGRRTRRISAPLRRALRVRDDGCRFPGCTNRLTDAHHVVAWARGGTTRLDNLCSLCRRHHRFVHEHGYRIERTAGGELALYTASGAPVRAPRLPCLSGDPFTELRLVHRSQGLIIDADTARPRWNGDPVDYDLVTQALVITAAVDGRPPYVGRENG